MEVTGGPLGKGGQGWKDTGEQTPINRNVTKIIWAILIISIISPEAVST